MKIYNPNREERAFLYQEAQDLQPLMKDLGTLSVMVEEVSDAQETNLKSSRKRSRKETSEKNFRVTFVVAPESLGMQVQATDANLFDATIAAKEEAQRQLNAIVNSLPTEWNTELETQFPPGFLH
ncbi:MAG: hypothetical protein AB7G93_11200 [Bdellovibrionales bacterium]